LIVKNILCQQVENKEFVLNVGKSQNIEGEVLKMMCIKKVEPKLKKKPKMLCFGKEDRFHTHSQICMKCKDYVQCKRKIYSKLPKNAIITNVKGKRKGGR
jgi:hypothetical protein